METTTMNVRNNKDAFSLTSNQLKLIAVSAMLADHIAVTFFSHGALIYTILRFLGRFTAPIMFYQAVEGYHYTRNPNRYMMRLGIFALISYVPFVLFATGSWPNTTNFLNLNVLYTILLGLLAIKTKDEVKNPLLKAVIILALLVLSLVGDLAYLCVIMMLAMDFYRGDYKKQAFAYLLIIMGISELLPLFLGPFAGFLSQRTFDLSSLRDYFYSFGLLVPIGLIGLYKGEKGKGGSVAKWGFYVFYPLHMLVLGLIKVYLL